MFDVFTLDRAPKLSKRTYQNCIFHVNVADVDPKLIDKCYYPYFCIHIRTRSALFISYRIRQTKHCIEII